MFLGFQVFTQKFWLRPVKTIRQALPKRSAQSLQKTNEFTFYPTIMFPLCFSGHLERTFGDGSRKTVLDYRSFFPQNPKKLKYLLLIKLLFLTTFLSK